MYDNALKPAFAVLLGMLCLLIVPILNGSPIAFADTRTYYVIGQRIAETIGADQHAQSGVDLAGGNVAPTLEREQRGLTVGATRSPYYSFYLWSLERIGGLWFVVFTQALIASFIIKIFSFAAVRSFQWGLYTISIGILTLFSTLPIQIGFIMPDFFTGIGVLSAICLLLYQDRLPIAERCIMWILLLFSTLSHTTNIPLILVLAAEGYIIIRCKRETRHLSFNRVRSIVAAAFLAIIASYVYSLTVQAMTGEKLGTPPFLTARLFVDGPGQAYLSAACAKDEAAYALCAYKDRATQSTTHFLWDPNTGIFGSADNETRKRLSEEQSKFVFNTIMFDPSGVLEASVINFIKQLVNFDLSEIHPDVGKTATLYSDPKYKVLKRIVPGAEICDLNPLNCTPKLSKDFLYASIILGFSVSIIAGAVLAFRYIKHRAAHDIDDRRRAVEFFVLILLLLLVNAFICGAFSEPVGRYQLRMLWLFPFCFSVLWFAHLSKRSRVPAEISEQIARR